MSVDFRRIRDVCALEPNIGDFVMYAIDIYDHIAVYTKDGWKEITPYRIEGEVLNVKT